MKLTASVLKTLAGFQVVCETKQEKLLAVQLFMGISDEITVPPCHLGNDGKPSFDKMDMCFPYVYADSYGHVSANCNPIKDRMSITVHRLLGVVLETFNVEKVEVKLSSRYTAVVEADKITVGCRTFPVSIIADLAAAHAKVTGQD